MTRVYFDGDQMPLFPGPAAPDVPPARTAGRRVAIILGATGAAAGIAAVLFGILRFSFSSVPPVPIPSLTFDPGSVRRPAFTADVLQSVGGEHIAYIDVEELSAESGRTSVPVKRVGVEPRMHTLVRVPTSFGDGEPVPISRLWHPIDEKTQSFSAYRYRGDEPPFHDFYHSRPLAQKLGFGRNPAMAVEAGDLLYVFVYSDEMLSLYFY